MGTNSEKKGFDLKVHHFDTKSRRLVKETPYIRHSHAQKGVMYERSGEFFYENGEKVPPEANWVSTQATKAHKSAESPSQAAPVDAKKVTKHADKLIEKEA